MPVLTSGDPDEVGAHRVEPALHELTASEREAQDVLTSRPQDMPPAEGLKHG